MAMRTLTFSFRIPSALGRVPDDRLALYKDRGASVEGSGQDHGEQIAFWTAYNQNGGCSGDAIVQAYDAIRAAFDGLENELNGAAPRQQSDDAFAARVRPGDDGGSGAQYLSTAADALSLTDVVWFPTVRRVFLCGYDLRRHPSLWAWHERMRAHAAIAPFVEPMGGLGNAFYVWQYLTGTTLEKFVEAHRRSQPFRLKV